MRLAPLAGLLLASLLSLATGCTTTAGHGSQGGGGGLDADAGAMPTTATGSGGRGGEGGSGGENGGAGGQGGAGGELVDAGPDAPAPEVLPCGGVTCAVLPCGGPWSIAAQGGDGWGGLVLQVPNGRMMRWISTVVSSTVPIGERVPEIGFIIGNHLAASVADTSEESAPHVVVLSIAPEWALTAEGDYVGSIKGPAGTAAANWFCYVDP